MKTWSSYILAQTIDEALQIMSSAPGMVRPVAGGTDLLLDIQQGHHPPVETLVDISGIEELQCLEMRGDSLFIGAAVPVRIITDSPIVRRQAQALTEACGLIGGPQVRNTATLGGNVAHALPAADGTIALVALDARVEIASPDGRRLEPILNLFQGVGKSNLQTNRELLVGFHIPRRGHRQASAFGRVMRPQGVALPILNLAAWLEREGERIKAIRIAAGPSGPVPQRAAAIEACLTGVLFNPANLEEAKKLVDSSLHFRTSPLRASAEYRYHLCKVLLEEVVTNAWQRALTVEVV
jgi:CO/xanthine dehydrogenase FAD-binding subunit